MTVNSYVGRFGRLGIGKESAPGTLQATLTNFLPFVPPESIFTAHAPIEHKGIAGVADEVLKMSPGPLSVTGAKFKIYAEPENVGELLMAAFGADTVTEAATFVVTATNKYIDFKEDGGTELSATLATGSYKMGTSSSVAGSLCAAIKTALEAVGTPSAYTITYSYSTRKVTITKATGTVQILWATGTNHANSAYSLLGFTAEDTSAAAFNVSDSTTAYSAFSHAFTRLQNAVLPTYTLWLDKQAAATPNFVGAMLNKFIFEVKAKEYATVDSEFNALKYDSDSSQTATFSALKPFTFNEAVITAGGTSATAYDTVKIEIDNMVKAEHTLGTDRNPTRIYSEGMSVKISMDFFLNDLTEYNKFLAGTASSLTIQLNSAQTIDGTTPYSITFTMPNIVYTAAPRQLTSGVLKIPFQATAYYDLGGNASTITAALVNRIQTAY